MLLMEEAARIALEEHGSRKIAVISGMVLQFVSFHFLKFYLNLVNFKKLEVYLFPVDMYHYGIRL